MIALFNSCFIEGITQPEANELKNVSQRRNSKVVVLNEKVKIQDDIKLLLNGELAATGDCTPRVQLGLIKKNHLNGWDTIVNINELGTLLCGLDRHIWSNDTITTSLLDYNFIGPFKKGKEAAGSYCFTYMEFRRNKTVIGKSNEFEITYP